jgi:dsRNA-specific ribonuclease
VTIAWIPDDDDYICGDDNTLKISAVLDDDGNQFLSFLWDQGFSRGDHYSLCIAKKQKDETSHVGLTDSERDRLGMYLREDEVRKRGMKKSKKGKEKVKEAGKKRKASEISSTPESNLVATVPDTPKASEISSTSESNLVATVPDLPKASEISSTPDNNLVATMPDLPKLTTDIILDVFTHRSLQNQSHAPSQSERLAELGGRVLGQIVTDILFNQRPLLNAAEIAVSHTFI